VESIEHNGETVYRQAPDPVTVTSVDHAAFYQLKTMLQGVLARGTARSMASLAPFVAGKTGTSDNENDAWFVGFTNDVTVAVWIGYDNAGGKRRTLGGGATGGGVAVPIFEPVIQAVWASLMPRTALAPPSPEARRQLSCKSINLESGEAQGGGRGFSECLRIDATGKIIDTQYRLLSRESAYAVRDDDRSRRRSRDYDDGRTYWSRDPWAGSSWGWRSDDGWRREEPRGWQQRSDPGYFWGGRRGW
jgi:penicillin-binding protein 1A